uniref:Large ribosomal subunit protein uL18c n=1 Tax=Rhodochaete parvula TaxID=110510 RepID=A0A220T0H5_9RHOD|nr:ribosomal protein L18 [Rhodochaete parvula]
MKLNRKQVTANKHSRIRLKVKGSNNKPRLTVFRSNQHIYTQVVDDEKQITLTSSSTIDIDIKPIVTNSKNCEAAKLIGETIAKKALSLGIRKVVFDRGGYLYHGKIRALANAARTQGLEF